MQQRAKVVLQPLVTAQDFVSVGASGAGRAIVHVVELVGNDIGKRRQRVIGQIGGELREGHHVGSLLGKGMYVAVVGEGVVRLHVGIRHVAGVPDSRQTLHVGPPAHAVLAEQTRQIIDVNDPSGKLAEGDDLSGSQHEVVGFGRMNIGIELRGQSALRDQAVQIWRRRPADDDVVFLILKHHQKHACSDDLGRLEGDGSRRRVLHHQAAAGDQCEQKWKGDE